MNINISYSASAMGFPIPSASPHPQTERLQLDETILHLSQQCQIMHLLAILREDEHFFFLIGILKCFLAI